MRVEDFVSGAAATPNSIFFQDGLQEIGIGETEGLDLGFIGNILDPLGVFKTGGPPPPGSPPGTPGTPGGLLGGISQGVSQALGMGGAGGPLGSLFGAGIGGVMPGTGPLPGSLGQAAQSLFGQSGLPPADLAARLANPVDYNQIATHTEKAGRAIVRRILGGINPPLTQIRQMLAQRRNQIQATAEHKQLVTANQAHQDVMGLLSGILSGRNGYGWKA